MPARPPARRNPSQRHVVCTPVFVRNRVRPPCDLDRLLPTADVVIEASRPRALRQRGVVAEDFPGVWISITAYGRDQPDRIGYGDDTAVAGGLVGPGPSFLSDAVADPLTGAHAALAA